MLGQPSQARAAMARAEMARAAMLGQQYFSEFSEIGIKNRKLGKVNSDFR